MPTQKYVTKEASIWCQVTLWPITQDPGGPIDREEGGSSGEPN